MFDVRAGTSTAEPPLTPALSPEYGGEGVDAMSSAATPNPAPPAGILPLNRAAVDVFIPAFNERVNLPHAVASVIGWANKVIVLDSGSTDGTQQVARELGAVVVEHPWEGYARQKNWGLDHLPLESPWVLIVDADEAVTPELRDEIVRVCNAPPAEVPEAGFYINRYFVFMGKRIRHCGYFPSWNLRLFRRGKARYEDRPVHEHMTLDGKEGYLRGLLSHEDRRGLEFYIAKHNRYSTLEAEQAFRGLEDHAGLKPSLFGNALQRRRFLRTRVWPLLPGKPLARFLYMYVLRLGFLDGLTGYRFCRFIATHEFFVNLKLADLRRQAKFRSGEEAADSPPRRGGRGEEGGRGELPTNEHEGDTNECKRD